MGQFHNPADPPPLGQKLWVKITPDFRIQHQSGQACQPFPHPGAYRFEITIDGDKKASVPLTVSQLPAPPAGGSN